ncbi:MAG: hypothetical protein ABUK19_05610, partial [Desulfobacteria bacterium]
MARILNSILMKSVRLLSRLLRGVSGTASIEYGLIAALIVLVVAGAVAQIGPSLAKPFVEIAPYLEPDQPKDPKPPNDIEDPKPPNDI